MLIFVFDRVCTDVCYTIATVFHKNLAIANRARVNTSRASVVTQ